MENLVQKKSQDMSHIKGWGVDADPRNDPTYPIKNRTNEEHQGYNWDRPFQQPIDEEILHSNERPNVTAVFGTSVPPSGLSGMIRRFAFKHSEGRFRHWLALLLADRVNAVEGIVDDISHGHLPNICAEKGMKAEWENNPKSVVIKVAIGAAIATSVLLLLRNRK